MKVTKIIGQGVRYLGAKVGVNTSDVAKGFLKVDNNPITVFRGISGENSIKFLPEKAKKYVDKMVKKDNLGIGISLLNDGSSKVYIVGRNAERKPFKLTRLYNKNGELIEQLTKKEVKNGYKNMHSIFKHNPIGVDARHSLYNSESDIPKEVWVANTLNKDGKFQYFQNADIRYRKYSSADLFGGRKLQEGRDINVFSKSISPDNPNKRTLLTTEYDFKRNRKVDTLNGQVLVNTLDVIKSQK